MERIKVTTNMEVKSASRVLELIGLVSQSDSGLTFSEIVEITGLPRSSLHGLLRTMVARQALEFDDRSKRYSVGLRLWEAGQAYLRTNDLAEVARPFMEEARDRLQETLHLAVLDGLDIVYIAKSEADQRLVLASKVGGRLPAHATGLGKMLLASLRSDELARRLREGTLGHYTTRTITDPERLKVELASIRRLGFARDTGEHVEGIRCLAVPILNERVEVCAAMSVSVPVVRWKSGRESAILETLRHASLGLSRRLGHKGVGRENPAGRDVLGGRIHATGT